MNLKDGETTSVQGSGSKPYTLKNVGGVYSCSCPAWRNQSLAIEQRTCKHLRKYLGDAHETARTGGSANAPKPAKTPKPKADPNSDSDAELKVLLAETWDGEQDPTGMFMSEKLDGVRAYWNGKMFLSRQGNQFHAPDWFIDGLPSTPLDGELWLGRKMFQKTISIVKRQDKSDEWKKIKYRVFDAPEATGGFKERLSALKALELRSQPYWSMLEHRLCTSRADMDEFFASVEALGGEGIMLRDPASLYERFRSTSLLKVKRWYDDEAIVDGHEPGKGRLKGTVGALWCKALGLDNSKFANGTRFKLGSGMTDADHRNPPPIGSIVTFKYQELTDDGKPRFPVFIRVSR